MDEILATEVIPTDISGTASNSQQTNLSFFAASRPQMKLLVYKRQR